MSPRTDGSHALRLGLQVLWRVCDERATVVRLYHRYALDRLLARRTSPVSFIHYLLSLSSTAKRRVKDEKDFVFDLATRDSHDMIVAF